MTRHCNLCGYKISDGIVLLMNNCCIESSTERHLIDEDKTCNRNMYDVPIILCRNCCDDIHSEIERMKGVSQ